MNIDRAQQETAELRAARKQQVAREQQRREEYYSLVHPYDLDPYFDPHFDEQWSHAGEYYIEWD